MTISYGAYRGILATEWPLGTISEQMATRSHLPVPPPFHNGRLRVSINNPGLKRMNGIKRSLRKIFGHV